MTISPPSLRRSLLRMIGERLLPLASRNNTSILLMEPASLARNQYQFSLHSGAPLQDRKRLQSPLYLHQWHEQQVHAVRYPCLAAVVEGEIDWRIGITQSTLQRQSVNWKEHDYLVMPLAQGTFFLMPPGVPYSTGHGLHWERPEPREGQALLFWMLILPSGFMCHYCRSTATQHQSYPTFFVPSQQVHQLTRMLEEELGVQGSEMIARAHLQAILGYAQRGLQSHVSIQPLQTESTLHDFSNASKVSRQDGVQRAQSYIESHIQLPLTAKTIAAQAYLSTRQLDRYFSREFHMTLMEYVVERRIEMAKVLLQDTDLPISQIGQIVGYPNASSFTQIFKRHTRLPPSSCRRKNENSNKVSTGKVKS